MTKHYLAADLLTAAIAPAALAQDAPPYTLTANLSLVSQHYLRGLTQTWGKPAVQAGFDFVHGSRFYSGVRGSNVCSKHSGVPQPWQATERRRTSINRNHSQEGRP